ncbi:MAG: aldo/keto reductase [Planctomycetes bacterium]|nr:aldo/keto reductase [Planctomycetota bacterium]
MGRRRDEGGLPLRILGRTAERCAVIGFGGILADVPSQQVANRTIGHAIDAGVNLFDVSPAYGEAEVRIGRALGAKRERVILAGKTKARAKDEAAAELRTSLRNLRANHFDLYQLHHVDEPADLERALGPGGAIEAILEARELSLVRWIGIASHRPSTLLAAIERFPFDAVMLPVNFVLEEVIPGGFAADVLRIAAERKIGAIAVKPIAARPLREGETPPSPACRHVPLRDAKDIDLAIRFTLSMPVAAAIPSSDIDLFRSSIRAARRLRPLGIEEREALAAKARACEPLFHP